MSERALDRSPVLRMSIPRVSAWVLLVAAFGLALYVHAPSLRLGFSSDDFDWWLDGRMAVEDSGVWFAPSGTFYRPANRWSMAVDYLMFRTDPMGFHATNLLLHLSAGALFWLLLGRFGYRPAGRALAIAIWLCSPFTLEPAQSVAIRFELILLLCWLGLVLVWPAPARPWRVWRLAVAVLLSLLGALTKESWVILPGFVFSCELWIARRSIASAVRRSLAVSMAPVTYTIAYFHFFPGDKGGYFSAGIEGLLKVPHALAAFLGLTTLRPAGFRLDAPELLAALFVCLLTFLGWRRRSAACGLAVAFLLLPFVPIFPVGFMTTRYTTLPFLGFVLLLYATLSQIDSASTGRVRLAIRVLIAVGASAVLATGIVQMSKESLDARLYSDAHLRLIQEATAFRAEIPADRAIVVVRLENENPLVRMLRDGPSGFDKMYFQRQYAPYGLADWAALFSYVRDPDGGPIFVDVAPPAAAGREYAVIAHVQDKFLLIPAQAAGVPQEVAHWMQQGTLARVLVPWP
ncbi:MAG: hypothetical protein HYX75_07800 [Acidobacteria bacterium]|nr:hypothetical protein [Acidobacteriota bacterium]